jgi:CelD/BcsL family acetyltransferase involved in cellulose biosynthesis
LGAEWAELESESVEGNAFLSADFVLPAFRHLGGGRACVLAVRDGANLVGLGVFEVMRPTVRVPMIHYRAHRCEHSYMSGLLLRSGSAAAAADAIFGWFRSRRRRIGAVEFFARSAAAGECVQPAAARAGVEWVEYERFDRATLVPGEIDDTLIQATWSKNQRKKMRRYIRDLETFGCVSYRTVFNRDGWDEPTDTFVALEGMGWKGDQGSSIGAVAYREAFYREVVDGFARRGQSYFSQLLVDDEVVATSSNFVSGGVGFGFKIGWNPEYAGCSPGVLHEHEYVRQAPTDLAGLRLVDATADPDSFVNKIWPHRRTMVSGAFATGRSAAAVLRAARAVVRWRRRD